jgi:type II secretory pathway component PulM
VTRWIGLALLAAAIVLYVGVARPAQREAAAAGDEYRRARDERRDARARLQRLERRVPALRAADAAAPAPAAPGERVRVVRRAVVRTVEEAGLSPVRLSVRPGRPPAEVSVQLGAEGSFDEVVRFGGLVARPETGIVLQAFRLAPGHGRVTTVELDAVALGGQP